MLYHGGMRDMRKQHEEIIRASFLHSGPRAYLEGQGGSNPYNQ